MVLLRVYSYFDFTGCKRRRKDSLSTNKIQSLLDGREIFDAINNASDPCAIQVTFRSTVLFIVICIYTKCRQCGCSLAGDEYNHAKLYALGIILYACMQCTSCITSNVVQKKLRENRNE